MTNIEEPGGRDPEASGDVSTNVDLAAFDVTVDGMVIGEMGPVDHQISFNAYASWRRFMPAGGYPSIQRNSFTTRSESFTTAADSPKGLR